MVDYLLRKFSLIADLGKNHQETFRLRNLSVNPYTKVSYIIALDLM
jgi:hypothetical protein